MLISMQSLSMQSLAFLSTFGLTPVPLAAGLRAMFR